MSAFGVILIPIFPHSNWIRRDTTYLSVFSPNAGKCGSNEDQINSEYGHLLRSVGVIWLPSVWFVRVILRYYFNPIRQRWISIMNSSSGRCSATAIPSALYCRYESLRLNQLKDIFSYINICADFSSFYLKFAHLVLSYPESTMQTPW